MTINWSLYEKRLKIDGDNFKDQQINIMKNTILDNFQISPSYNEVYFNNSEETTRVQILDDDYGSKKVLMQPDDNINIGDLLYFNSNYWLCTEVDKENLVYQYGIIQKCNNQLTFHHNNTLHTIPIVIESQHHSMLVDENKYISELKDTIIARISYNEVTSQININEIFKIGKYNYKLINTSDVLEPGLIILKLQIVLESPEEHNYYIEILNGISIQISQSQQLIINAILKDDDAIIESPTLLYSSSNEEIATINENGEVSILGIGNVIFTVYMSGNASVNSNISVEIIEDIQNNFTYELLGNTDIYVGYSNTFTANKYNNGVLVEDGQFDFSIINNENAPTSAYTLTIVNDTQCSIKANDTTYYLILRATDRVDNTKFVEVEVKLKNLF